MSYRSMLYSYPENAFELWTRWMFYDDKSWNELVLIFTRS